MCVVSITLSSPYYQVKLILTGVPSGSVPYSTVDGSVASPEAWILPNKPEAPVVELSQFGFDYLTPYTDDNSVNLMSTVLGNDVISVSGALNTTTYTITVFDLRSKDKISEGVYSITGDTITLPTNGIPTNPPTVGDAIPISTVPLLELNPPKIYMPGC
jgi:hypothetical protein